jgi:hypothetical protein
MEEISKYKLDLVGVQEVRWDGGGTERAGEYTFSYGRGNENHELDTKKNSVVLVRQRTIPIERSPPVSEASANFSG